MTNLPTFPSAESGSSLITRVTQHLQAFVANEFGLAADDVDIHQPFASLGLSSIGVISMIRDLEERLGISLSPSLAWDYPTIEALAHYVVGLVTPGETQSLAPPDPVPAQPGGQPVPSAPTQEPIAVIGMACRFPGARNLKEFWKLLCNGGDAIREIPAERWDADAFYDPTPGTPGKMVTRWGGFLEDIECFDAAFFNISPREAVHMDPRQRLLLEVAWEALEDAGIPPDSLAGSQTGVFIATLKDEYGESIFAHPEEVDAYTGTGSADTILANRLSYFFDLHGPSLTIDTACSGSLVAVHLACQSLRSGESSMALVGGANLILKPDANLFFSRAGALAPDGRCKTFDARADGIVRSDGVGLVVLKRLSDALADQDHIYALILGSAVNQDGRTNGLMAPSGKAQERVLRQAYRNAGISPGQVQYIEAHGTGTRLGDPIEVQSLGAVLSSDRPAVRRCMLGSVKTNLGHMEAAAGIAGLIKVALSIHHRLLPPSLHFQTPNPLIPFDSLPFSVQRQLGPWPQEDQPLIAGVSSFGFGGTNAHVVLREPPAEAAGAAGSEHEDVESAYLLPLSARTPAALRSLVQAYHEFAVQETSASIADICSTASVRRTHFDQRLALIVRGRDDLEQQLAAFLRAEAGPSLAAGHKAPNRERRLVWICSGEGPQWAGIGRELIEREPVFRSSIEACDRLLRQHAGWSLVQEILADEQHSRLHEPEPGYPALVALQIALAALWRSWDIVPALVVGQGLGEVAAAHIAGALSLPDAMSVAFQRGRLAQRLSGKGGMAVVGLPFDQASLAITVFDTVMAVAGSISSSASILSGDQAALERLLKSLERRGVPCRMLPGEMTPPHTPYVDVLQDELREVLAGLHPQQTVIPLISAVAGTTVDGLKLGAEHWARSWREPFRLDLIVAKLLQEGYDSFLEISPQPLVLHELAAELERSERQGLVLASLKPGQPERVSLLEALAALYAAGYDPNWRKLYAGVGRLVSLPGYPWQRERYWFTPPLKPAAAHVSDDGP
ncbi:MAG: hypothetical protein KatS3mg057_2214 [Herpetosiphonaceae bacterium]|nr:MAG: hypothetical protein KatS3mg057_2214 [Herpetosiphonaceae bacterium]